MKSSDQKEKEIRVQKEIIINGFESAVDSNIRSYNEALMSCQCEARINPDGFSSEGLLEQTDREIKHYYADVIKRLSNLYILKLESCLMDSNISTVDD